MRADSRPPPPSASAPVARIGMRYQVLERLGHGGMATVYRVRDPRRGEDLALKQLNAPADASRARELTGLFEREFYTLAQLSHPSVIEAYDFGLDPNGPYYTMELLDGGDLAVRAPIEPREACRLFVQVCSSLCLLHARRLVHRDISPRNVRLNAAGRAKLIDFGALIEMGPCPQTIGTPAFVAPEVVQRVALDARTDLFSLGASLYYALTKRPAFPVRSFDELRAAWRTEFPPPSALVPGVPPALDKLVADLLRIDPTLRPNTAFEVMQRLTVIGGLARTDAQPSTTAYFTTPRLVGREPALRRFRKHLRKTLMGRGGGLSFEAAPGLGRSRLLDACVLEAKTVGATVLRLAGNAASPSFGGAHAIAVELLEVLPEPARRIAESTGARDLLLAGASEAGQPSLERFQADRQHTLATLASWITALSREQLVVIAADDTDHLDEPTLALLAALALGARETRVLLVLSGPIEPSSSAPAALGVLRNHCARTELAPLTQDQIEELFSSVFGNSSHLAALGARIHQLAEGSPREAIVLAEQLLDDGVIRYADGQWVLPAELSLRDLPASLDEAMRARISSLPPLALRLAQTQALAHAQSWTRADYAELARREIGQLDAAIDALRRHGVITGNRHVYTLGQAYRAVLVSQLTAAETAERHLELAGLWARSRRPTLFEIHHLLLGGAVGRALDLLAPLVAADTDETQTREFSELTSHEFASCFENAFERSIATGRPPRESYELARMLTSVSVITHARLHRKYAPAWLARLELDSGLGDYRASARAEPGPRLMAALASASQRYDVTPAGERVYRVDEAIKYLVRYVVMSIAIGVRTRDLRLLASLPGLLEPFAPLSPVLHAVWQNALSVNELSYEGRLVRARARLLDVYEKLGQIQGDQLKHVEEIRRAVAYGLANVDVSLGMPSLEAWLTVMDQSPQQRVAAEYIRALAAIYQGDNDAAERYRKHAEVLALQASATQMFGPPVQAELTARVQQRDLAGVRRVADLIAQLAVDEPGWVAPQHLAQGWYQRLRGDSPTAVLEFESCFASNQPDQVDPPACFNTWAFASLGYINALVDLGRAKEAREFGQRAIERCRQQDTTWAGWLEAEVAVAEASSGEYEAAAARVDALIAREAEFADYRTAGYYEARASIAILARDKIGAAHFAELATRDLVRGQGHKLLPCHARMREHARRAGIDLRLEQSGFEHSVLGGSRPNASNAIANRALEAVARVLPNARPQRILELVCEAARVTAGQLYAAAGEQLLRTASIGAPEPALDAFAASYFRQQLEDAMETSVVTEISAGVTEEPRIGNWTSPGGTQYRFVALTYMLDAELVYAGLAALEIAGSRPLPPQAQIVARALAAELAACESYSGNPRSSRHMSSIR